MTIIFAYYNDIELLRKQLNYIFRYKKTDVIIVDDCSDSFLLPKIDLNFVKTFRIKQKINWNWLACRNIGAKEAKDGWLLLTDIDHIVPLETIESLKHKNLDGNKVYYFNRIDLIGNELNPHGNSYLITKKKYFEIGGYDERLSGSYYGTTDHFRKKVSKDLILLDEKLIYIVNKREMSKKRSQKLTGKPKILTFDYEEV